MLTVGIDPGLTGAVGVLNADGSFRAAFDLPIRTDRSLRWVDAFALRGLLAAAAQHESCRVVIERVSAMPRQGVSSTFAFGVAFGSVLAALDTSAYGLELVSPRLWKVGLNLGRDKRASLERARELFPAADLRLAKHHNRAEALLLAYWALRMSIGRAAA